MRFGTKDRRKWDEIGKKRLLWLYYHSPILLLWFSYDAYMMLLSCSYVRGCQNLEKGWRRHQRMRRRPMSMPARWAKCAMPS